MSSVERQWSGFIWSLVRCGLSLVFIYAGLMKLREPLPFADSIARFEFVPEPLINSLALGLPPLEILCGISLWAGPWKRQAAFGVALLCLSFLGAFASAAWRGISIECSCFGSAEAEPIWKLMARDLILLAWALAIHRRAMRVEEGLPGEVLDSANCAK
jgi:putative oxidoreductase